MGDYVHCILFVTNNVGNIRLLYFLSVTIWQASMKYYHQLGRLVLVGVKRNYW